MDKQLDSLYAIDLLGILISGREEGDFQGELVQQYSKDRIPFYGTLDLIKKMESFYDEWDYPEASSRERSFKKREKYSYPDRRGKKRLADEASHLEKFPIVEERGSKGSFFVHTKFRQRTSWQGDVYHGESGDAYSFSSVLHLFRIMERECAR